VPSDSVIDSIITVTADGVLIDSKHYFATAPVAHSFVSNFVSGAMSTSFITFKNVPVRMMASGNDIISMDATTKDRITSDKVVCTAADGYTETTVYVECPRAGADYNCNFASSYNFTTVAPYADVTCAISAVVADSTSDLVFSIRTVGTVNIGPAAAAGTKQTPVATFDIVTNFGKLTIGSGYANRVPAGMVVKAFINLYNLQLAEGDAVSFSFYSDINKDHAPVFAGAQSASLTGCTTSVEPTRLTFTKDASASNGP
jgi:hypothetical protein